MSESRMTEAERLIVLANRDLRRAVEEDRFAVETPRGYVEQTGFDNLSIHLRYPTETVWVQGRPTHCQGSPILGVDFTTAVGDDLVMDLCNYEEVVLYGDQHLWRPLDMWEGSSSNVTNEFDDKLRRNVELEWRSVEEIDWR